jgi:hypothetical protein
MENTTNEVMLIYNDDPLEPLALDVNSIIIVSREFTD